MQTFDLQSIPPELINAIRSGMSRVGSGTIQRPPPELLQDNMLQPMPMTRPMPLIRGGMAPPADSMVGVGGYTPAMPPSPPREMMRSPAMMPNMRTPGMGAGPLQQVPPPPMTRETMMGPGVQPPAPRGNTMAPPGYPKSPRRPGVPGATGSFSRPQQPQPRGKAWGVWGR